MKTSLIALALSAALAGCAGPPVVTGALSAPVVIGASPEAQIKTGADTVKALHVTATKLLANHVITVTQAKSFRNMLVASGDSLDDANTVLLACRATTVKATPDPCWPKVSDVVTIALANVADIKRALESK